VRAKAQHGFSLIELMVTIAIAAILLAIAAPSFDSVAQSMKLTSYANSLVASIQLARSEAIKRNAVVSLCVSSNGSTCETGGWEQGWIVMCNSTDNTTCDPAGANTIVIESQPAVSSGWKITESSTLASISFQPTGTGANAATLTVCRASPSVSTQERVVRISASGRPSVTKTANAACS
jgi:type IV fimbrial biogenesis protein FimT